MDLKIVEVLRAFWLTAQNKSFDDMVREEQIICQQARENGIHPHLVMFYGWENIDPRDFGLEGAMCTIWEYQKSQPDFKEKMEAVNEGYFKSHPNE